MRTGRPCGRSDVRRLPPRRAVGGRVQSVLAAPSATSARRPLGQVVLSRLRPACARAGRAYGAWASSRTGGQQGPRALAYQSRATRYPSNAAGRPARVHRRPAAESAPCGTGPRRAQPTPFGRGLAAPLQPLLSAGWLDLAIERWRVPAWRPRRASRGAPNCPAWPPQSRAPLGRCSTRARCGSPARGRSRRPGGPRRAGTCR
jgi:hypothetical protein